LRRVATILLYGDTIRYPALRHEVPLEIVDPFLFIAREAQAFVLTSSLEAERISNALPDAEVVVIDELGFYELMEDDGMAPDDAELETAIRAVERCGVRFEDLLLITGDGCETLTRYAYEL
jgi:hypothetical protein